MLAHDTKRITYIFMYVDKDIYSQLSNYCISHILLIILYTKYKKKETRSAASSEIIINVVSGLFLFYLKIHYVRISIRVLSK